jgi:nucleotide-binding universal stress UspA family protein
MYQRILVPVDGSPTSKRGLAEAIELARLTGGAIRVLHVIDEPLMAIGVEGYVGTVATIMELMEEAGRRIAEEAVGTVRAAGVLCDSAMTSSLKGRVCDLVVEAAQAWKADVIVIGTHGRRGVNRFMLGSDAEQILRLSPVPVLLVRAPAPHHE